MKKIILSFVFILSTIFYSNSTFAQWTAHNAGFPTVGTGMFDKINAFATVTSTTNHRLLAATNSKGVRVINVSSNGLPSGNWQIVPGCPYPNNRVSSIASIGNTFYVCFNDVLIGGIEYPVIYKCVFNGTGYSWTLQNNATLPSTSLMNEKGILKVVPQFGAHYIFYSDGGDFLYRKHSGTAPWTTYSITPSVPSIGGVNCMMLDNGGTGYLGTGTGVYSFSLSGTACNVTNLNISPSYPICLDIVPYKGPATTSAFRQKKFFALMTQTCGIPYGCPSRVVRYEKGSALAGPDMSFPLFASITYSKIMLIPNPVSSSSFNTGKLIASESNAFGGILSPLLKSVDDGNTTLAANSTAMPSVYFISTLNYFGPFVGGTAYIGTGQRTGAPSVGSNLGFHYYINSSINPLRPDGNQPLENGLDNEMTIFPNPTNSSFSIKGNREHEFSINILDVKGTVLFKSNGTLQDINDKLNSYNSLANGLYLINIKDQTTGETKIEKLIKN